MYDVFLSREQVYLIFNSQNRTEKVNLLNITEESQEQIYLSILNLILELKIYLFSPDEDPARGRKALVYSVMLIFLMFGSVGTGVQGVLLVPGSEIFREPGFLKTSCVQC